MKKAIILHGICDADEYYSHELPSSSNSHWVPWLQKHLLIEQYDCQTPDVLNSYKAIYNDWLNSVAIHTLDEDTVVVAHSAGCGFFLKYLSENPHICLNKLIMVAPFKDPFLKYGEFLKCKLDKSLSSRVNEIFVFYSVDEDVEGIKETVDLILTTYPNAVLKQFEKHGHFCLSDMGTEEFPELLNIILR